jgi:hypothetical protein
MRRGENCAGKRWRKEWYSKLGRSALTPDVHAINPANAGVSAEEALKEWTANLIPGVTLIPSGTWGDNRAQEAGCTYCAGG